MHSLQGLRCCRELEAIRFPEFLMAAIEQGGYFSGHHVARAVPPPYGRMRQLLLRLAGVPRFCQDGSSPIFAHQELVCDPGHPLYIKSEGAESAENFIEGQEVYFCSHGCD